MKLIQKNNQGNAIVAVTMAMALIAIAYNTVIDSVIQYKAKVTSFKGDIDIRLGLHSTMDFVIFGVKQQYCFDDVLMQDASCDLKHAASVERLIMSVDQLNYIKTMITNGTITDIASPNDLPLRSITKRIGFSVVSTAHPLYIIFQNSELNKIATGVEIQLTRDNSLYLPKYGGEIYVNISVKLYGLKNGIEDRLNANKLSIVSKVSIHPRELGSFALLMPKDLRLDKSDPQLQTTIVGDVGFHQFTTNIDAVKAYPGLVFLSPVYVNQNIFLPQGTTAHYTPVTFADKVYMGNGSVYKGTDLYKPRTTGGLQDRYWGVGGAENFGGFLKGVENDGGLDRGLSVFGRVSASANTNYDAMRRCIARSQSQVNNEILRNNSLSAVSRRFQRSGSTLQSTQRLILSNGDEFKPQDDRLDDTRNAGWIQTGTSFNRQSNSNDGTLVRATLELISSDPRNNLQVSFDLADDNDNAAQDEYVQLSTDFARNLQAALQDRLDNQNDVVVARERTLSNARADKVQLLTGTPSAEEIAAADSRIATADRALAEARQVKNQIQTQYDSAKNMNNNPPAIKIYLDRVYSGRNQEKNKMDLNVIISNEKSLVDKSGNPYAISIKTKAFNLGYRNQRSILRDNDGNIVENNNLDGFLNYFIDGTNSLTNPAGLSNTNATPATATTEDTFDYVNLDANCESGRSAQSSQSFGSAGYFTDFSPTTRASWNFAGGTVVGTDPTINRFEFNGTNASTSVNSSFQIRSIVGECVIKSDATFVTGFFACDRLTIESRRLPLRIIGTFIVGKISIQPEAYAAGIVWSSIYHPQAVFELRRMAILKPLPDGPPGENCSSFGANNPNNPIWHPIPSVQFYSNRENCNVISLRAQADPFRWTSVDPDCGLIAGKTNTVCKHKINRFHVFEHSRGEND